MHRPETVEQRAERIWIGELATNPALQLKLVALGVAILNTLVFHWRTAATVAAWDRAVPTPMTARVAALVWLEAWMATITLGRLIAYV